MARRTGNVDAFLRPDLSRILPRPVTRPLGGLRFDRAVSVPGSVKGPDYLLDVDRDRGPVADETGFELHQAQSAAEQVARSQGSRGLRPGLFALDPARVQRLLS